MSLTDRDRKLVMILLPVVVLAGYWFLILGPQRNEASSLDQQLVTAQSARDESVGNQQRLSGSRSRYASDYETVVRLGKAIPSTLDMPSLLVQLESAAKGTGIDFDSITAGQRTSTATASTGTSSGATGSAAPPVAAGGEAAKTGPGKATEQANGASATSADANKAAGADSPASGATGTPASSGVAGLDTVPLKFTFNGSYFSLADFFHRVKRFVRVANKDIAVKGRLMTIDGMNFKSEAFPKVIAEVSATVYLSPKSEGAAAGGTPQGPVATPASTPAAPAAGSSGTPAPASSQGSGQAQ